MPIPTACAAIDQGVCLELHYDGFTRVVEVHCVGTTTAGNPAMRVYQVRGGSSSGERTGWKLLTFDKTFQVNLLNEPSEAPRDGYTAGDKGMAAIIREV